MSSSADLMAAVTGQFGPGRDAPVGARRFAREFVARAGADQRCQEVTELLVSELVTNAVKHARSAARLRVQAEDRVVRVEVADDGPGQPVPRRADVHGGYGLWLVDCLAWSWGTTRRENGQDGKTVWFTLPLSLPPGP
ncbi:MAG TPA: ATP-binding protein [Trebonia sp.]|jgi:anti-sigma regulatory factor (Ser/Thr protein kinase)|nr:ATP-binding protein [Trebonia sp.]